MEEKFRGRVKEESRGALWQRYTRGSTPIRIRLVHGRGSSTIPSVQKMWRKGVLCGRE